MKVQGSAFYFGNEVDAVDASFSSFFEWLKAAADDSQWPPHKAEAEEVSHRREMFLNELEDEWCGVIVSARTTQFHHYVKREGDVVTIEARDNEGDPPVEINFFCLRKDNWKGVYSHYYGSYAFNGFLWDLWSAYRYFVESKRDAALDLLGVDYDKEIVKAYSMRGKANTGPMFSPKAFQAMLSELSTVGEVRLTTYDIDATEDEPVAHRIRNIHHVFRLEEQHQHLDKKLKDWILEKREAAKRVLANGNTGMSGSVRGFTPHGEPRTIMFGYNLEDYLNFDYDEIGTFNVANLHQNPCLAAMLAKLRNQAMFK